MRGSVSGQFQQISGKKSPGDPFQTTARQFNDFVDAAEWVKNKRGSGSTAGNAREWKKRSGIVKVKNVGTENRSQFEVCGVESTPLFDPAVAHTLAEFKREPSMKVRRPKCEHASKFVVLLEPIPAGAVGDAIVSGVVQVQVEICNEDDEFADIEPQDATKLVSVTGTGGAQILAKESAGTGLKWCLVRLSNHSPLDVCVSTSTTSPPTQTTDEPTTQEQTTPTTGTGGTGTTPEPGTTGTTGTGGTGTTGTGTTEEPGTTTTPTTGTTGTTTECPPFLCLGDCMVSFEVVTDVRCVDGNIVLDKATLCMSTAEVVLPVTTTGGA